VEASCLILQGSDAVIKAKLKTLAVTVYETSDQVRVGSWSDGHLERHARPHSNNKN